MVLLREHCSSKIKHICDVIKPCANIVFPLLIAAAHLKAHESDLSRCNIASTFGHRNARDVVRVAMEESLFPTSQTLNDNSAAKRINEMFFVWMHFESRRHMTCINNVTFYVVVPLNYIHFSKYRVL